MMHAPVSTLLYLLHAIWHVLARCCSNLLSCCVSHPYLVVLAGLIVTWIYLFNVIVTYHQKLTVFMTDMLGEGGTVDSLPKVD